MAIKKVPVWRWVIPTIVMFAITVSVGYIKALGYYGPAGLMVPAIGALVGTIAGWLLAWVRMKRYAELSQEDRDELWLAYFAGMSDPLWIIFLAGVMLLYAWALKHNQITIPLYALVVMMITVDKFILTPFFAINMPAKLRGKAKK